MINNISASNASLQSEQALAAGSAATKTDPETTTAAGATFSELLDEQLSASRQEAFLNAAGGGATPYLSASGLDLTSFMLDEGTDIKDMLLMLCAMFTSGMGNSSGMASMLPMLALALSNSSDDTVNDLRQMLLGGDYGYEGQYRVNDMLFSDAQMEYHFPYAAGKAVNPVVTSDESNRNAGLYKDVIDQFNVETNPRYKVNKRGNGDTYCNIFMWDVTLAMGAEIPHYIDPTTKEPRVYPDTAGARELNTVGICDWLNTVGNQYGWVQVSAEEAQNLANSGYPAVAVERSHVMVVCPSKDGQYDESRGPTVAQAGGQNLRYTDLKKFYSASGYANITYWAHR